MERPSLLIVGLGGSGIAVLNVLPKLKRRGIKVVAADTDAASLAQFEGKTTIDLSRGTASKALAKAFAGADALILVTGLGGDTGGAAAIALATQAQKAAKHVGIVALMPFPFEAQEKLDRAADALLQLQSVTTLRTIFHGHELLHFIHPSQGADEAWREIDLLLADTTAALAYSLQELGHNHSDLGEEVQEREPWKG